MLLLIFILVVSGVHLLVEPCVASEATLATPTFTIVEIASPYDFPPTYTTNPYTGETVLFSPGGHVENKTTYIQIKNQPFTQDPDRDIALYYQLRFKGHYLPDEDYYSWQTGLIRGYLMEQSDSEYTFISFDKWAFQIGDQVDIQIRAVTGGYYITAMHGYNNHQFLSDCYSDWSSTQTLTIGSPPSSTFSPSTSNPNTQSIPNTNLPSDTTTTSNLYNTPSQTSWQAYLLHIVIVAVCLITLPLALIAYQYGKRKTKPTTISP